MRAVDNHLTFKEVVRARAREAGFVASFMPKPFEHLPGCGLHVHLSLWDAEGENEVSCGAGEGEVLSETGRRMAAGLLAHARGSSGVGSPIVNSYKRLQPGSWAPAHVGWGTGNRAVLVRVPGSGTAPAPRVPLRRQRGEPLRVPHRAARGRPRRYRAGPRAPGADRLRHRPRERGGGAAQGIELLPRSLPEALDAFEADPVLTRALGPVISTEHLEVKRSELSAYDLHVHPWERHLYLEQV